MAYETEREYTEDQFARWAEEMSATAEELRLADKEFQHSKHSMDLFMVCINGVEKAWLHFRLNRLNKVGPHNY